MRISPGVWRMATVTDLIGGPGAADSLRARSMFQVPEKSGRSCALRPAEPRPTMQSVDSRSFILISSFQDPLPSVYIIGLASQCAFWRRGAGLLEYGHIWHTSPGRRY